MMLKFKINKNILENPQQKRIDTLKKKHPDLVVKVPLMLNEAGYPNIISKNDIICRLEDHGILIQSQSRSTSITFLMLDNGYVIGNMRNSNGYKGKYIHYKKMENVPDCGCKQECERYGVGVNE